MRASTAQRPRGPSLRRCGGTVKRFLVVPLMLLPVMAHAAEGF